MTEPKDRSEKPHSLTDDATITEMVLPPFELEIPMPPVEPPAGDETGPVQPEKAPSTDNE